MTDTLKHLLTDRVQALRAKHIAWEDQLFEDQQSKTYVYLVTNGLSVKKGFTDIRQAIQKNTAANEFVQVIGSSTDYSHDVTHYLNNLLTDHLRIGKSAIVYGATGPGANDVVNTILHHHPDLRNLLVGNLVDASFEHIDCSLLPAHLTYLFNTAEAGTTFGDDNHLADALSDRFIVVGGGMQTFDQMDIAMKEGKHIDIVVSTKGNVHDTPRFSAGDILFAVTNHPSLQSCTQAWHHKQDLIPYKLLLSELCQDQNLDKDRTANYLATWMSEGYLETLISFDQI